MNYATDRLDRASRHREGIDGLWNDYRDAFLVTDHDDHGGIGAAGGTTTTNHTSLGSTLCALGWNRQAMYHFGLAYEKHPSEGTIGDYAQMAELSGWPEVGLLALLCHCDWWWYYRKEHEGAGPPRVDPTPEQAIVGTECDETPYKRNDASWLLQAEPCGDCGCGDRRCGASVCPFPNSLHQFVDGILTSIDQFLTQDLPTPMCSAHEIHRRMALRRPLDEVTAWTSSIPRPLRLWEQGERGLTPVLQMLLVKLLYLTIPALACAMLTELKPLLVRYEQNLAKEYKSHAAFYTFIQHLVLGDRRVKPARRHIVPYYHVPIWDLCHGVDERNDFDQRHKSQHDLPTDRQHCSRPKVQVLEHWRLLLDSVTTEQDSMKIDNSGIFPISWAPLCTSTSNLPPLFLVGDSHVLSLAWQVIQLPIPLDSIDGESTHASPGSSPSTRMVRFVVVPVVITGLKAWHCRTGTRFFTHTRLIQSLRRLSSVQTIVFSAGEIDCREGLGGPRLAGYRNSCSDAVSSTVGAYVDAVRELLDRVPSLRQALVLPVAPHASQSTSRVAGQVSRRELMREWNDCLRYRVRQTDGLYMVDYIEHLVNNNVDSNGEYVLRSDLAADSTHMNAAFARHFEEAVVQSGCRMEQFL